MRILLLAYALLMASCAHHEHKTAKKPEYNPPTQKPAQHTESRPLSPVGKILSPYSSEGIIVLNQYRTNNSQLDEFLKRNRKPDYFIPGQETEFKFQKIYLVYMKNENLYLFDSSLQEPYKKFHPFPLSIKESLDKLGIPPQAGTPSLPALPTVAATSAEPALHEIEKTLSQNKPEPFLEASTLSAMINNGIPGDIDLETYYFDKPLVDLVENQYSIKYEAHKNHLKIIFPQFYETSLLYQNGQMDTRKIIIDRAENKGLEIAVVVPDFLSGSGFYQNTRGNMTKAFSSLYQLTLPDKVQDHHRIRMRFQLKICQNDSKKTCISKTANGIAVRGVVLSATFYDNLTKTPIETITLK